MCNAPAAPQVQSVRAHVNVSYMHYIACANNLQPSIGGMYVGVILMTVHL